MSTRPLALLLLALACTLRPAEDHVRLDERVGRAETPDTLVLEEDGLAAIREATPRGARLWAASPVLHLRLRTAGGPFELVVRNTLRDATLTLDDGTVIEREPGGLPTEARFVLDLPAGVERTARLAPPDADAAGSFHVAVLSDVQDAIGEVQDIYERMRADPSLRFVVSTGDLTDSGTRAQLVRFQEELETLPIPLYSTVGNHEVPGPEAWHDLFGPFNAFFRFRGVAFSLVDSSTATVDPALRRERLRPWLEAHRDAPHLFLTHVPILDASGLRSGAFRSRNEAASLLQELADAEVDALFFGHVHSYYAYSLAGIESYIAGGGGAIEEELDG
ncbi:MAG TPA: metallophosphoesterase, partial [Polyangiaceae bacterium LLY-WYZ-15_(1-7)]|nr:metallophosphoesterase [Polyangiaceae bacterium LLY-WYZ-15_(1-7)]